MRKAKSSKKENQRTLRAICVSKFVSAVSFEWDLSGTSTIEGASSVSCVKRLEICTTHQYTVLACRGTWFSTKSRSDREFCGLVARCSCWRGTRSRWERFRTCRSSRGRNCWTENEFRGRLGFEGDLPAVAWLKARSTSVTRDTHGTWDWLVDFLHQPLGGRADLTGGVIEVLFCDKIVVNPQLLLKQTFVPKNRPSWDIPQYHWHQSGCCGTCDRYDRIPCSKSMDERGCWRCVQGLWQGGPASWRHDGRYEPTGWWCELATSARDKPEMAMLLF